MGLSVCMVTDNDGSIVNNADVCVRVIAYMLLNAVLLFVYHLR